MNLNEGTVPLLRRLDFILLTSVTGLIILGIAFIYSSGVTSAGQQISDEWLRQIIWSGTGFILLTVFALIDYQRWRTFAIPFYGLVLLLLIIVLIIGSESKGSRAWLGFSGLGIQPSEFAKLAMIIMLAWWFDERGNNLSETRLWIGSIVITLIPMLLVLIQPDLGTAIVYLPILIAIAFVANIRWSFLLFPLISGALIIITVMGYVWSEHISESPLSFYRLFTDNVLVKILLPSLLVLTGLTLLGRLLYKRKLFLGMLYGFGVLTTSYLGIVGALKLLRIYQLMRFVVFLDPQVDPKGAGWHIIQSITAVGSGGMLGKGFLQGTQSHYRYLPEQSTDFIFSILAEELGFIGCLLVFLLFTVILFRTLYIAYKAQDHFGTYIAVGIAAMISYHVTQNIGMAIGVMPITGIPLFFLSYGGSSLWTALMSTGILLSIHFRRLGN